MRKQTGYKKGAIAKTITPHTMKHYIDLCPTKGSGAYAILLNV